jgi:hypothetical protein
MLAGMRSHFSPLLSLLFSIAICLPVFSQVNGVPASVTSFGFGGSTNPTPGVRASVTSLGPNGLVPARAAFANCCANFFWPPSSNLSFFPGAFPEPHRRRRNRDDGTDRGRNRDRNNSRYNDYFPGVGSSEPYYVPYPVPYAQDYVQDQYHNSDQDQDDDYAEDDSPDGYYLQAAGVRKPDPAGNRKVNRSPAAKDPAPEPVPPAETEEPVTEQPSTVLVFKDGHHSDVVNYAIVGDTLFDFADGRAKKIQLADLDLPATRKANDDRGVDFQIPPTAGRP